VVLPDAWAAADFILPVTPRPHTELVVGWLAGGYGAPTAPDSFDALAIRAVVTAAVGAQVEARLVVGGSPAQYRWFGELPETQRRFVPVTNREDFAEFLSQVDVLLLPNAKHALGPGCDDELLLAGAAGVAWVAAPGAAYRNWLAGGLFAEGPADWQRTIQRLLTDSAYRQRIAAAGKRQASTLAVGLVGTAWLAGLLTPPAP
jgi:glycosyltransferase involved in cell wall biosynthesis